MYQRVFSNPYSCYKAASKLSVNNQQQQSQQSQRSIHSNPNSQHQNSQTQLQLPQRVPPKLHNLKDHSLSQNENSYSTNIFYIRYAEEKVQIGDCINFRTEIEQIQSACENDSSKRNGQLKIEDLESSSQEPTFYLKVELMFKEATEEQIKNPRAIKLESSDNAKSFQVISTKLYKINNILSGLNEFYPVQFDTLHFSTITITLHSALMDFKFRKYRLNEFKDGENQYRTQENNIRVVRLKAHTKKSRSQKCSRKFQNLTEFLFADDKEGDESVGYIPIEVEVQEIEKKHQLYIQTLINMYDQLKKRYKKYLKQLPQEQYEQLIDNQQSKFTTEPCKLVITHEATMSYQSFTNVPSPTKKSEKNMHLFQKLNTTIVNKTKLKIESSVISNHQSSSTVDTTKHSNQSLMMNHKVFQYLESQQQSMSRKDSLGLRVNNFDIVCTKSKLDQVSKTEEESVKQQHMQSLRSSNILQRRLQNESIEREISTIHMKLEKIPQSDLPLDTSVNMDFSNVSNILDENPSINAYAKQSLTCKASQECSFVQNPSKINQDQYCRWIDEEPLSEGFDALPEALTKTISTKNLQYGITQLNSQEKKSNFIQNNLPPPSRQTNKKSSLGQKENKCSYISQTKFSFVQNYSSKVLQANQNVQNLKSLKSQKPPKFSKPAVPQTQFFQKSDPLSPSRSEKDEENSLDISTQSINFSEQKRKVGLNIPHIQINQRNLQNSNSGKSYFGIFISAIKGHHDPQFITKIIDSEVRQISVQIFKLWHQLINIYCCDPMSINKRLKLKYQQDMYDKASEIVVENRETLNFMNKDTARTTILENTQKVLSKKSNGSINEIRQLQISGIMLNSMQAHNNGINTQRANSMTKSQINSQKSHQTMITPNIQSLKHKMSHHNIIIQAGQNTQYILNQHSAPQERTQSIISRKNLSSQYNSNDMIEEDDFDLPNSPTKIIKAKNDIEDLRRKLQSQKETKIGQKIKLSIEDTDKKFRQEYEPLIVEEKYSRKGNKYDKSLSRPSSLLSSESDKLQNTLITDLFKNAFSDQKKEQNVNKPVPGQHLFVFVHGFQASSYDMRAIKNSVSILQPRALVLCSQANENFTEGSIEQMGINLANEVKQYIKEWCYSRDGKTIFLKKLTFVGHSLGGLIIRTALPSLVEYKNYMHGYMSLGSPHLGYMYNSNSLIDAGMWVLKRWKKSECLQQLSMSDAANKSDSFLYKLSNYQGLNWFKHVILCSSYQDNYAPHDSARIQVCSRAAKQDIEKGNSLYVKMAQNILDKLQCESLYRLDINFKIDEKNLDAMIGRTAHILLLECEPFIEALTHRYKEFFCE